MAHVEKFKESAVVNQIRHCKRNIKNNRNKDIDPSRTHLNYSLTPDRGMGEYSYYKKRKSELYCYGRKDLNTMAGWIVTAPKELKDRDKEYAFFHEVYKFLEERYGQENVICAEVHYDEGKMKEVKDRWGSKAGEKEGTVRKELVLGRPHLHFIFIPVVPDKNAKHIARGYTEKICCNDVLNRTELRRFHSDLEKHLKENGISVKIQTGITKAHGRNYTVEELKEHYEMEMELHRLRENERSYQRDHERFYGGRW